jgi:hypothetical protein
VNPDHSAYVVRRRDDGREIVRVFDFRVGDVIVLLLHLCRNFPVEVDCPEHFCGGPEGELGYLWVPADKRAELDDAVGRDPRITWQFVCLDLWNGQECAFYRDRERGTVDLGKVARQYFAESVNKLC